MERPGATARSRRRGWRRTMRWIEDLGLGGDSRGAIPSHPILRVAPPGPSRGCGVRAALTGDTRPNIGPLDRPPPACRAQDSLGVVAHCRPRPGPLAFLAQSGRK